VTRTTYAITRHRNYSVVLADIKDDVSYLRSPSRGEQSSELLAVGWRV
jgi:hypothetical protein